MVKRTTVLLLALFGLFAFGMPASAVSYGNTLYSSPTNQSEYSRVIKLANGNLLASHSVEYGTNDWAIRFYRSTDNGANFSFVSEFKDTALSGRAIGGGTMYEVSSGTVLLAYQAWNDNNYQQGQILKVWRSTNGGASWNFVTTVENSTWTWEPEFARSSDGKLQLYYSWAPTMNQLDQVIVRRESSDNGTTWGARITAFGNANFNIGMPRIVKASSNLYYMAYENYEDGAMDYVVSSTDGKTWVSSWGNAVEIPYVGWWRTTPVLAYANGVLFAMGKDYMDPFWYTANAKNGQVCYYSKDGGQTWKELALPFTIQQATTKSNWSSTLLPLSSSQLFLIAASDASSSDHTVRYGTGAISTP